MPRGHSTGTIVEARAIFQAWRALSMIKLPSRRVVLIGRELRRALTGMGFRIDLVSGIAALRPGNKTDIPVDEGRSAGRYQNGRAPEE